MAQSKILVVDDEPANRRLLADLVTREGYEALTAAGGREALALLSGTAVDLVLLDIMMPEVDGLAVLAELQKRGMLPALPVIVVTAHEDRKVRLDALTAGAIDFITKPFDRTEVACKVRVLTELKRLRDAAKSEAAGARAELSAVLDCAPDFVVFLDREGIIKYVNRVLPWQTMEKVVGASWTDQAPTAQARETRTAALASVFELGKSTHFESGTVAADGSPLLFESHIGPVHVGGELVGAVIVARDMTEKKRTEMQLMVSDRMASVGTLAAGVAHEINNPLAAVLGNLDLALGEAEILSEKPEVGQINELREELQDARDCAERIRLIVRDLKLFSRAEEPDRKQPVDVERVLESTLRMAWNEIRHRARLVKEYGSIPLVTANESRLGQVFLNLVVNAAQAIPEGNAEANEIRIVTAVDAAGRVQVDVRDTGPGIPPEVLSRLFTPFFTTKPAGSGTGLGLSICQRLVKAMGGEIHVESVLGQGTLFRVLLPPAASDEIEQPSGALAPEPRVVRRGRILVVDDEPSVGQVLGRCLAKEHDVSVVERARDALALLLDTQTHFDVILCDLMMPEMTGMDLYQELERCGAAALASRIIFLSGGAFTQRAREFLDHVPNLRIEKPFVSRELLGLVNERIH
jgi:PAS domain S-box-containing protein